jgi:hypothetical protein
VDRTGTDGRETDTLAAPRLQTRFALVLLGVMFATCAGVSALSRSTSIHDWMLQRQMEVWHRTNVCYAYNTGFSDSDDRLLLQEVPAIDHPRGGVYFIGSSTTQHAIATWLLPEDERTLVHNLAIKSANVSEQFQFLRYLVEERGLLDGDAGKTLIVFGLAHFDTRPKSPGTTDWNYIPALFERHGLYDYDVVRGITDLPLAPWLRALRRERMRCCSFIDALIHHTSFAGRPFGWTPANPGEEERKARAFVHEMMGGAEWKENMARQLEQLAAMFDYLHRRGAAVAAVLLPLASWNHELEEAAEFDARVHALCRDHGVALNDESAALPDADFADHAHLNCVGEAVLTPILAALAREHLVAAGLLRPR